MGNGRRYDHEYNNMMIVDLFKSGMSLAELSSEYGIAKSTINDWIKDMKEIKVTENEVMTLKEVKVLKKEMARIKRGNQNIKKSYGHIHKKITTIFDFITNDKKYHDIKLMCKVLKVSRSSYYKYLNQKPSNRELENKKIEKEIINIYKASKNRYGSLKTLGITISLRRTQRLMKKLEIKSIIIKKFRPSPSKRKIVDQKNVLRGSSSC